MSTRRRPSICSLSTFLPGITQAALVVVALFVLSALAVSASTWLEPVVAVAKPVAPQAKTAEPASHPPMLSAVTREKRMGALIIKLRRTGFEPAQLTNPQGQFLLAFDNRTGADEIVLQLKRDNGNKLREVKMPRGSVRWRQALDLNPGRYVLSVAAHPEWVCQLTITAR